MTLTKRLVPCANCGKLIEDRGAEITVCPLICRKAKS